MAVRLAAPILANNPRYRTACLVPGSLKRDTECQYVAIYQVFLIVWARQDSNLRPKDYESSALTAELRAPEGLWHNAPTSSGGETRTLNHTVNSRVLCQLSYPGISRRLPGFQGPIIDFISPSRSVTKQEPRLISWTPLLHGCMLARCELATSQQTSNCRITTAG